MALLFCFASSHVCFQLASVYIDFTVVIMSLCAYNFATVTAFQGIIDSFSPINKARFVVM